MNLLFVGPYRQQDEQGIAAQNYIKAIASQQKYKLTTRPIFLSNSSDTLGVVEDDILLYENSFYDNYDVVIQKTLPHCLFYNKKYKKNIGLFALETNHINDSSCVFNINQMDEIWVSSYQEKKCLIKSGVTQPIKNILQPIDVSFISSNRDHKIDLHPILKKTFKFYFIGEYTERKNIEDLVTAFHLAFDITDPVSLIIKTSMPGISSLDAHKIIENDIGNLKKKLNIHNKYKKEIIITEKLSHKDLIGLHNACDCFVMPSYGEAFCKSTAEALVLGKTPIVTDNTGMNDYINAKNGYLIKSHKVPVILNKRILTDDFDIYNAKEYWYKINVYDLIEKMRDAYSMYKNERKQMEDKKEIGIKEIEQFSYENIGKKLCI